MEGSQERADVLLANLWQWLWTCRRLVCFDGIVRQDCVFCGWFVCLFVCLFVFKDAYYSYRRSLTKRLIPYPIILIII